MTLPMLVAAALFVGVLAYALFGGADFGSGFFDLTAGGSARGAELRTLVDHNRAGVGGQPRLADLRPGDVVDGVPRDVRQHHVDADPAAAAGLLGIVLRGASFAFRKYAETLGQARLFGAVFAGSSLIAPFFFGTIAGAMASGRVPATGRGELWSSWVNPTSLFGG